MAVGHLGILNIGPHLLLQILRQRIHVFQIYRVSRGVNGRRGIIQQHVPVFFSVRSLHCRRISVVPSVALFGVNATGHHALVGPHRPWIRTGSAELPAVWMSLSIGRRYSSLEAGRLCAWRMSSGSSSLAKEDTR